MRDAKWFLGLFGLLGSLALCPIVIGLSGCDPASKSSATAPLSDDTQREDDNEPASDDPCALPQGDRSFDQLKGPAGALDGACVPEISRSDLRDAFFLLRDTQLGPDAAPDDASLLVDGEGRARRLPWLLADNACEERAPAAAYLMHAWGFPTPYYARAKAKPNKWLHLASPNFPTIVKWSSHVAPVLRSEGQLFVLDPAVEDSGPITVGEWLTRITHGGTLADLDAAFCRDIPEREGCFTAEPRGTYFPQGLRDDRLAQEWRLQQIMGRLPEETLGDCPPWVGCASQPAPASRESPPVLTTVIAADHGLDYLDTPLMIIGDNFVRELTTVEIVGDGFHGTANAEVQTPRTILVDMSLPLGRYRVTVFNDDLASDTLAIELRP